MNKNRHHHRRRGRSPSLLRSGESNSLAFPHLCRTLLNRGPENRNGKRSFGTVAGEKPRPSTELRLHQVCSATLRNVRGWCGL
ncbi:thiosulfate sulfurtransferase [Anopheles sinensis]|uniref:Thiosulfate sulfurtransferase n=1 Tax=Anopheles sinensis TaxID=74873 RepID=A0A084VLH0_ANOSI|nr:thiosulfate sulfurtransferase [Anopheles sinensis]